MFSRIVRNFTGLSAWTLALMACIVLTGLVALSNYLGCKIAFELQGFEMQTLGEDGIVGGFFQIFLSEGTMAGLMAIGINFAEVIGFLILFHLVFRLYDLGYDLCTYRRNEDNESAKAALRLILRDAVLLVLFTVPMVFVLIWDLGQFRYRSISGALGIEDPAMAASTIKAWELQLQENGHLFVWYLSKIGARGYLCVTILASAGMSFAAMKIAEYWVKLCSVFEKPQNNPPPNGDDGGPAVAAAAAETINSGNPPFPNIEEELRDVISEKGNKKVTLTEALANPKKYWVDPENLTVWDAEYRRSVTEDD